MRFRYSAGSRMALNLVTELSLEIYFCSTFFASAEMSTNQPQKGACDSLSSSSVPCPIRAIALQPCALLQLLDGGGSVYFKRLTLMAAPSCTRHRGAR